jgi:hypothetical protein
MSNRLRNIGTRHCESPWLRRNICRHSRRYAITHSLPGLNSMYRLDEESMVAERWNGNLHLPNAAFASS